MLKKLWPVIVWAIGILILTGIPGSYIPTTTNFFDWVQPDKIVHFILFGGLSFLVLYAYREQFIAGNNRLLISIIAISIGIVYGLLTEVLQYYVFVGRNGNYLDFMADVIGAIIGILAFYLYYRKKIAVTKVNKN